MAREVQVTYGITRRFAKTFEVTDDEYYEMEMDGAIPEKIKKELDAGARSDEAYESTNWAAVDMESGRDIIYWN